MKSITECLEETDTRILEQEIEKRYDLIRATDGKVHLNSTVDEINKIKYHIKWLERNAIT